MAVCKRKKRKTDYTAIEENEGWCNEQVKQYLDNNYLKNSIFGGGMHGQFFGIVDGVQIPLDNIQSLDEVDLGDVPETTDKIPGSVSVEFTIPVEGLEYINH